MSQKSRTRPLCRASRWSRHKSLLISALSRCRHNISVIKLYCNIFIAEKNVVSKSLRRCSTEDAFSVPSEHSAIISNLKRCNSFLWPSNKLGIMVDFFPASNQRQLRSRDDCRCHFIYCGFSNDVPRISRVPFDRRHSTENRLIFSVSYRAPSVINSKTAMFVQLRIGRTS